MLDSKEGWLYGHLIDMHAHPIESLEMPFNNFKCTVQTIIGTRFGMSAVRVLTDRQLLLLACNLSFPRGFFFVGRRRRQEKEQENTEGTIKDVFQSVVGFYQFALVQEAAGSSAHPLGCHHSRSVHVQKCRT